MLQIFFFKKLRILKLFYVLLCKKKMLITYKEEQKEA